MKKLTVILLVLLLSLPLLANGPENLYYGLMEGSSDLATVIKKPAKVNYLQTISAVSLTAFTAAYDRPLFDQIAYQPALQIPAALLSASAEPIGLGITYTCLGWNNKELARKMVGATLYNGLNTTFLKYTIGKSRPWATNPGSNPTFIGLNFNNSNNSFPSGHSSQSFSLATVLADEYPQHRWWFYAWSTSASLSRILLGCHWPSDVVAGAFTGIFNANHYLNSISELESTNN